MYVLWLKACLRNADPTSATRRTGGMNCNRDAHAGLGGMTGKVARDIRVFSVHLVLVGSALLV
jgi:hypothetical protein